ncbi:MAG: recombination regulator RecX [Tissierellia bacterium]|nr:recombination regulator RecX [Tissierellia bacterium]
MKITKIESQKNNNRVNIYIDGEFAFGLMAEIQYKYNLFEGMEIDTEYIEQVLLEEEQAKAKDQALRFLSYRQRSEKEIIDKLKKKGFSENTIENTLIYLKKYNLINDLEFAKSFANDKINLNGFGPKRIKYELYKKGISHEIIQKVLEEDKDNEYERALELGKKKINSYKNDDKYAKYRKLGGFLQRKGYSYECTSKVLKELVK